MELTYAPADGVVILAVLGVADANLRSPWCSLCGDSGIWGIDTDGEHAPCSGNADGAYWCPAGRR